MDIQDVFQLNRKSTERLKKVVQNLSKEELTQTTRNKWPVFINLAHVAFWDQRVIHVVELAKKNNMLTAPLFDLQLNDILTPLLFAIPPEAAVKLAFDTAGSLDSLLEECPGEIINEMMKVNPRLVNRSLHRNNHLDSIEAAIPRK
jgi:hypothetical protein